MTARRCQLGAAPKPIEERTRCSPIWPSTRRSASDASRRPSKSPGAGAARGTLSEHRARSRYGRHDGRARGDDRSIPMSDRAQQCAAGRAGGAFTRRWGRARSDAPDARAGPATVDERTAGVLPQPARRTTVGVDDADAGCRACRGDARRVWRARRCPWLVDGRQHRAAARGRSPGCGPAAGLDQHRLSSGTGRSDGAPTRCRAHPCWRGPPSASGDGGRVRSALARPVHRRGRGLGAGDALVPRRRSVRHGHHERGRGHFDLADYPTIASSTLLLADGRDRFYDLAILGETAGSVRRRVCRGCLPRSGHGFGATLSEPAVAANGAARRPGRRLLRRVGRRC